MTDNIPTHLRYNFQDISGKRYGMLVAVSLAGSSNGKAMWSCRCDCQNICVVSGKDLRRKHKMSCGCSKQRLINEACRKATDRAKADLIASQIDQSGKITLRDGLVAFVDIEDLPIISKFIWNVHKAKNCINSPVYARTSASRGEKKILMHVLLMGTRDGYTIDHVNRNGLDNRRANLRWATQSQNIANRPRSIRSTCKYKGVIPPRNGSKIWGAAVSHKGTRHYLGKFLTEEDAARAYDRKALELHGEFAFLNFKDELGGN